MLLVIISDFDVVCKRSKLRVNIGRSKVMVSDKTRDQILQSHVELRQRERQTKGYG